MRLEGSSFNTTSDRKIYGLIYNDYLKQELPIEMNRLENGKKEFNVQIVCQDAYYSVEGIMDEKEFKMIVENLQVFNK